MVDVFDHVGVIDDAVLNLESIEVTLSEMRKVNTIIITIILIDINLSKTHSIDSLSFSVSLSLSLSLSFFVFAFYLSFFHKTPYFLSLSLSFTKHLTFLLSFFAFAFYLYVCVQLWLIRRDINAKVIETNDLLWDGLDPDDLEDVSKAMQKMLRGIPRSCRKNPAFKGLNNAVKDFANTGRLYSIEERFHSCHFLGSDCCSGCLFRIQ